MKKLLYITFGLVLFLGMHNLVLAEDTTDPDDTVTTTSVSDARTLFIEAYLEKKATLETLREETKIARDENNTLVAQIKTLIQNKDRTAIEAKINEINELRAKIKGVITEAKTYVAEKQELRQQIMAAMRSGGTVDVASLTTQRDEVIAKLTTYKTTLDTYRADLQTLIEELKTYRAEQQSKHQEIKDLYLEVKTLHTGIISEIALKNEKWTEFRAAMGDKNYGKATEAFDAIIQSKTKILNDLKAKNLLLKEIINKY